MAPLNTVNGALRCTVWEQLFYVNRCQRVNATYVIVKGTCRLNSPLVALLNLCMQVQSRPAKFHQI